MNWKKQDGICQNKFDQTKLGNKPGCTFVANFSFSKILENCLFKKPGPSLNMQQNG